MNGSTIQFSQLVRAYPQFTGINEQRMNDGSSYFHGLQARVEKRFAHGLQLLINYQFARTIENLSVLNDFGPIEKRASGIDRPHRFVTSVSYELPFGRGKAVGANSPAVVAHLIGGWGVNAIYSYESGAPAGSWGDVLYDGGDLQWDARNIDQSFERHPLQSQLQAAALQSCAFLPHLLRQPEAGRDQ